MAAAEPAPGPQPAREGLLKRKAQTFPYRLLESRFVLTDECLERFDPKSGQSKGKLLFAAGGCSVREEAKPANSFTVACGGEEHLLLAASAAERAEWVADIRWRLERPQREARAKAEAEARQARALGATAGDNLLFLEGRVGEARAAVQAGAEEWRVRVAAKQQEVASANQAVEAAKQAGDWEAAKEAQQASKEAQQAAAAEAELAAAAAAQLQALVQSAQARLQERVAWEPLLQVKLEAAEAAKQRLLAANDFDNLPAADAEVAAINKAIKRPLQCLGMTAEEAAAGECPV